MRRSQAGSSRGGVMDAGEFGDIDVHLAGGGAAASMSTWSRRSDAVAAVDVAELLPRRPAKKLGKRCRSAVGPNLGELVQDGSDGTGSVSSWRAALPRQAEEAR
ncbi:hypothetical protein BE11_12285 [Sorangium cellulosum]|nr:hypothetical protein BE11_12285 [Sorangium cellulosum]